MQIVHAIDAAQQDGVEDFLRAPLAATTTGQRGEFVANPSPSCQHSLWEGIGENSLTFFTYVTKCQVSTTNMEPTIPRANGPCCDECATETPIASIVKTLDTCISEYTVGSLLHLKGFAVGPLV